MKTLYAAMAAAFPEIEGASKDKNNPHFKSKYADLGAVVEAIKPALVKHGLFFVQQTHEQGGGVCVETVICHESGEQMALGKLFVPAGKQDAQGYGSALTYARRYSLMTAFGVCPEDDDGNAASRKPANDASERVNNPVPVAKKEKAPPLAGPYTSKTALWTAVRKFSSEIYGCGDSDMLEAFLASDESKALLEQCERDAPNLLRDSDIADYTPLDDLIAKMRADFEMIENNPMRAG